MFLIPPDPKSQGPQRNHENKANFPNYHTKDITQNKFSSHNDHRPQRNDRPPRFHKDTDFPKPNQEPVSHPMTSQTSVQAQQWKGQERWSRGTSDRVQNDRRQIRDEQNVPSTVTTSLTHSKEPQQQMDFNGSYHQRSQTGDGDGNMSGPYHRRGVKDNVPVSKLSSFAGSDVDGRGNNKRTDRNGDANNRRKGKADRPNSDHFDRQRDSGPTNFNSKQRSSGTPQEVGLSQGSRTMMGESSLFQNGDLEYKRTGPIKPTNASYPPTREQPPKKNSANNHGPKRRPGQGKGPGPRGPDKSHAAEHAWKPGDQCMALYWEDNKVCCSTINS